MRGKRLLSLLLGTMICVGTLVSCTNTAPQEELFSGVKNIEAPYGKGNDMVVVDVTFEKGVPVDVNIDVRLEDGGMKSELSANGGYIMDPEAKYLWHEQIDLIENSIKENNFDLSKITLTDEDGHTDAISGVSMKISSYLNTVQEALNQVSEAETSEN